MNQQGELHGYGPCGIPGPSKREIPCNFQQHIRQHIQKYSDLVGPSRVSLNQQTDFIFTIPLPKIMLQPLHSSTQ